MKKHRSYLIPVVFTALSTISFCSLSANAASTLAQFSGFYAPPAINGSFAALPESQNGVRAKSTTDYSQVLVSSSVSLQLWGVTGSQWSTGGSNCTLNSSNSSVNYVIVYNIEGGNFIHNKVRSQGNSYNYAGLKFCSNSQYNQTYVSGSWRPDLP